MTVFFEYVKDQDRYVHAILSDAKRINPLAAEQQIVHARATICAQCNEQFTKNKKRQNTIVTAVVNTQVHIATLAI